MNLHHDRWVTLDGAVNVRDLGGLPTTEPVGQTRFGLVLRSDNLQDLSAADVELLMDTYRVRDILDLRTDAEVEAEGPSPLALAGVRRHPLSLVPVSRSFNPAVHRMERAEVYLRYLQDASPNLAAAFRVVASDEPGAVIVHCAAGQDRTGVTVALLLAAAGVDLEHVVDDYVLTASVAEAIVARLARSETYAADMVTFDPAQHSPRAEVMHQWWALLHGQFGSLDGWAAHAGLDEGLLRALRARLVVPAV